MNVPYLQLWLSNLWTFLPVHFRVFKFLKVTLNKKETTLYYKMLVAEGGLFPCLCLSPGTTLRWSPQHPGAALPLGQEEIVSFKYWPRDI